MNRIIGIWLLRLLVPAAVLFLALNLSAYLQARSMLNYAPAGLRTASPERLGGLAKIRVLIFGVNLPRPVSGLGPAELAPDCVPRIIPSAGGVRLAAWHVDRGDERPLVILFHGYSGEKTSLLPEARAFLEMGTSVLLVDFRGSGGSSESYTTLGAREGEDVAAAYYYARERLPRSSLILFGRSMGAAAILRAVDESGLDPEGVILEAVFDNMLKTVRNRFSAMGLPAFPAAELLVFWGGRQFGFNGFRHNPVEYARSLACPALFLHGEFDPRATADEGSAVYAAAAGPKELVIFDRAGHEPYLSIEPGRWREAAGRFLAGLERNGVTGESGD